MLAGVLAGVMTADQIGLNGWLLAIIGSLTPAFSFLIRKRPLTLLLLGFILGHGTHGHTIDRQNTTQRLIISPHQTLKTTLKGIVIDTGPAHQGPYLIKVSHSDHIPARSRVLLFSSPKQEQALKYGDIIETHGHLRPIGPMRNPHGFDRQKWLHRQGTNLTLTTYGKIDQHGVSLPRYPVRFMSKWHHYLRKKMTSGLEPDSREAELIRAVVLGERPPRQSSMINDFRNSGTLHVFAVSGLHVGMVGTILAALLWFLKTPRWILISSIILGMAIYAGITGLRPPAVRAVIMASLFLSGFLIQRRPTLINTLAASAIIVLLWDGHQLFTPGFQLSYGVLLALALATGFWMKIYKPMAEIDSFMPRLLLTPWQERILNIRTWTKNSLSVSSAAWLGSAPLMWIHFGIITPIGIIASLPLVLLVFILLAIAMLGIATSSICEPAGKIINQTNALVAKTIHTTAHAFAHIPGGHWYQKPNQPGQGRVIVFDIPYGGAANFIDLGGGILLDSGRSDHLDRHVTPTLNALSLTPDSLIISHADSKHSGGMTRCLDYFHIKQTIIPRTDLLSPSYRKFLSLSAKKNCQLIIPRNENRYPIEPGVFLEILHAPAELDGKGKSDDTGLVIRLHWHGWRLLFTGDSGYTTESQLLENIRDLRADLIIMGRNRDDFSGSHQFLQAVSPKAIISSNCNFPLNERITDTWRNMLHKMQIHLLDQQQTGAVTIELHENSLTLTPTLPTAQPLTLHR